ncbi:MAG: PKD domain-containing protein [Phycisphaerae bacterium]|nr:PKD domain-containing protein [Phycisphaerae bacterium]
MKRCTSKRRLIGLFVLSWLLVLAFCLLSYGQNGSNDNDPHATGYLPPTLEEERHFLETHRRIVKVWPNRLAWLRVNEERKKKGLEPLPEQGFVRNGAEKDYTVGNGPVISGVPKGFVGLTSLSTYTDNSLLDAFPEIRTQGSIGSCTNFAITYYQLTYTAGRAYEYHDNKNVSNNDTKFSPKWTYNMINRGGDNGSKPTDAYGVLEKHGAARWSLFPYQTNGADPKSYREWCRDGETWRDAIRYRIAPCDVVAPDTAGGPDALLTSIKTSLANGEVLTFATYISGWQFTTLQDDKSTPDDNAFVRKPVASWVNNAAQANHMMTIVGYNDNVWTDINKNRKVETAERGALRIANSWGPNWQDYGFCWLAYDALRSTSTAGAPSSGRQPAIASDVYSILMHLNDGAFPGYPYEPWLLAKFKLTHAKRNQLGVLLAAANGVSWPPGALQFQGGPYAFDGTTNTEPCEGTFVFDLTEILQDAWDSGACELRVADDDDRSNLDSFGSPDGYAATLLGYKLIDMTEARGSEILDDPEPIDAEECGWSLAYPSYDEQAPVAVASAQPAFGRVPLTVQFNGSGSSLGMDAYVWDFGDGSSPLPVQDPRTLTSHIYSTVGTYAATLTVLDEDHWYESSTRVPVTATRRK